MNLTPEQRERIQQLLCESKCLSAQSDVLRERTQQLLARMRARLA